MVFVRSGDFWVADTAVPPIDTFARVGEAVVLKPTVGVLADRPLLLC